MKNSSRRRRNVARKRLLASVAVGVVVATMIIGNRSDDRRATSKLAFSSFIQTIERSPQAIKPRSLRIELGVGREAEFTGHWQKDDQKFSSTGYVSERLLDKLMQAELGFEVVSRAGGSGWQQMLVAWLPMIVLGGLFIFFLRRLGAGNGKLMSFGKSTARALPEDKRKATFADVAGIDEVREEFEEIIALLKDPTKFTRLGGRIPRGLLMMGPPGSGKTLLARAIAGETGVPFFSISGSDFVEMFVGVGASRVRDLFDQGKKNAPCIIFIDEIDAVGRQRGTGVGGGHDEREQTLNQLLVEMDGFAPNDGVILIAATNRPDVLDPALLRPGRFDRRLVVPRPDVGGREGILRVHTRKTPLSADVDLAIIARGTAGMAGADLENLVNEAALKAARGNEDHVRMHDFEMAKDKVLMGPERRSMVMSSADKRAAAYHEAGHALVARMMKSSDPVYKVTIIPRGRVLGLTQQVPLEDRLCVSKNTASDQIALTLGGRVAEEIVFGQITTGAGNDIRMATELARRMVCHWGMSDVIGPVHLGRPEAAVFLGRDFAEPTAYSEQTARDVDREIRRIVGDNLERARSVILANLTALHAVAEALLDRETIDRADLDLLLAGEKLAGLPGEIGARQRGKSVAPDTAAGDATTTALLPTPLPNPGSA
jgi:cell division protease FtsH